ncbi:CIA30 family protein [Neolewinella litorea]|uniref:CIA30 family protein n=1 Tax=Neolewinella litorea TaxID=2562452 RepID=A0A4S4NJP7_9BACT|nr:CIA30 family protein [Neolewinella litorea]THH40036.1 CIA30 family protein [Neolewinella litorea]
MNPPTSLYAFNEYSVAARWRVLDDIVMGGHSDGHFAITKEKKGRFYGAVSLRDGGGFSSVRHRFNPPVVTQAYNRVLLYVRGDGSGFEFRVKPNAQQDFSYVYPFSTSGEWEVIEVPLADMRPVRRGQALELPNFDGSRIAEISFLIANGREQRFQLLIDRLELL